MNEEEAQREIECLTTMSSIDDETVNSFRAKPDTFSGSNWEERIADINLYAVISKWDNEQKWKHFAVSLREN